MKYQNTSFALVLPLLVSLGGFLFGYQTSVIAGALSFVSREFSLTPLLEGVSVSAVLIGGCVGSLMAGRLADQLGRRKALLVTAVLFMLGSAWAAFSFSFTQFLIGRIVTGFGVGIVTIVAPLYLAEVALPSRRGLFISVNQLGLTIGILCGYFVNELFAQSGGWRGMFAFALVPSVLQLLSVFCLPETPPWLISRGRFAEAKRSFQRLRKDSEWDKELVPPSEISQFSYSWKTILTSRWRLPLVVGVFLCVFQQLTGINVLVYYAPTIFERAGAASVEVAVSATIWVGVVNVVATAVSLLLIDRLGRRWLLLFSAAGAMVCLLLLAGRFLLQGGGEGLAFVQILIVACTGFFAVGLSSVPGVVLSEIYPLPMRGKAMSLAFAINWICNYFVCLTFLPLAVSLSMGGTFLVYSVIALVAIWFIWRYLPETRGKSLEEIESLFLK